MRAALERRGGVGAGRLRAGGRVARSQRGSMAVTMLFLLLGLVSMLGLIEVGYLYWARRDTQKVADLAALAGAQRLDTCSADNSGNAAASGNALADNGFAGSVVATCGHWDPTLPGEQHFVAASTTQPVNATRVEARRSLVPFLGFAHYSGVAATAVAAKRGPPMAVFSVGSSLLDLNTNAALQSLLGSSLGTSLGLQLLSYNGIANARVSLLGLKDLLAPDVGTVDGVLATQVTISQFLDAYVQVLSQGPDAANVDLGFVQQQIAVIEAQLGNVPVSLGDILDVHADTDDPDAALDAEANALDVLNAVLLAADGRNAVALPAASINVPGVANVTLTLSVIEPPQIGVGGVGATARTAQVRLGLKVSALATALGGNESLTQVPLYLEIAPAEATITALDCGVSNGAGGSTDNVTIATSPGVLNALVGAPTDDPVINRNESWAAIVAGLKTAPLVNVNLLGVPVATLNLSSSVSLVTVPPYAHTFAVDPATPVAGQPGMTWPPPSATQAPQLGAVITSLLGSTNLKTDDTLLGIPLGINLGQLLSGLTTVLQPVLSPLFDALDTALVGPLLQTLGIEIGTARVNLRDLDCQHGVQLVF